MTATQKVAAKYTNVLDRDPQEDGTRPFRALMTFVTPRDATVVTIWPDCQVKPSIRKVA